MERGFRGTLRIRALVLWTQFLAINNVNLYRPTSQVHQRCDVNCKPHTYLVYFRTFIALSSDPFCPVTLDPSTLQSPPRRATAQPRTISKAHHPPSNQRTSLSCSCEKKTSVYAHIANTPRWRKTRVSVCLSCDGEGPYEGSEWGRIMTTVTQASLLFRVGRYSVGGIHFVVWLGVRMIHPIWNIGGLHVFIPWGCIISNQPIDSNLALISHKGMKVPPDTRLADAASHLSRFKNENEDISPVNTDERLST